MNTNDFSIRHIGNNAKQAAEMLAVIGKDSIDSLVEATLPQNIKLKNSPLIGGKKNGRYSKNVRRN